MTWIPGVYNHASFGAGEDGDLTINSGTTTLARNMHYRNLTVTGTARLNPNGFEILVKEELTITSGAVISSIGASAAGVIGGASSPAGTFAPTGSGAYGGLDAISAAVTGSPGAGFTAGWIGEGGKGGFGDDGDPQGPTSFYSARTAANGGNANRRNLHFFLEAKLYNSVGYIDYTGPGGGGGVGDAVASSGGGGGAPSQPMIIRAKKIIGDGDIISQGGDGGDGEMLGGGCGGGGAGQAGTVFIVSSSIDPSINISQIHGAPGQGVNGGGDGNTGTHAPMVVIRAHD